MFINVLVAISGILILVLGLVVFLNNSKSGINRYFFFYTIAGSLWIFTNLLASLSNSPEAALFWTKTTIIGASLVPFFFLIFSLNFSLNREVKYYYKILFFLPTLIFILLSPSPLNVVSATAKAQDFVPGVLYTLIAIYFPLYTIISLWALFRGYKSSNLHRREQYRYIFLGVFLSFVPGFVLGGLLPVLNLSNLAPIAPTVGIVFAGLVAFAILRHQLLDIRAVVARSFAFIVSIAILGVVYGLLAFQLISRVLPSGTSTTTLQVIYTTLAIVLAFTFQPIRRFFEKVSNAIFYRDKYDAQQLVTNIGRILAGEIELDPLSKRVIAELKEKMKIDKIEIVVFNHHGVLYRNNAFMHEHHEIVEKELSKLGRLMVVANNTASGERKEIMQRYDISVSLALRTGESFIGYLLLGQKKSGDIYSEEDLRTLKIVANELSVGIQNAKAFAEIQQFNVTLQQKIELATKNLRHANEQLKELDQAKDEFISMASHQLRTPLTTVKGYTSMLAEGDFGKLNKTQQEPVQEALDGASRMARLIDDLLNVSRMEAGRFFIDAQKTDVIKMVAQEIDQLQSLAKGKKVALNYVPPKARIPEVLLDENKTRQVVMNLVDNAIHYSQPPAGGGKVDVSLTTEGNDLVFKVQDNGIGVPKEQQDKLFHKMFRANNAKNVRPDGTGLGLYLVKRVVEDQGGTIEFQSEPGKGSTFGFRLPLTGVPKDLLGKAKKVAKTAHLTA